MPRPLTKKELESMEDFTPITGKVEGGAKKKLENIWYHYKFLIVALSCTLVGLFTLFMLFVTDLKPDVTVCLAGSYVWIDNDMIQELKVALADNVGDVNGDGSAVVNVTRGFLINGKQTDSKNLEDMQTFQQAFQTGLLTGQFFVILADPYVASVIEHDDLYEDLSKINKNLPSGVCGVDIADTDLLKDAPKLAESLKGFRLIPRKWSAGDMETNNSTKTEVYCAKIFLKDALKNVTTVTPFVSVLDEYGYEIN